MSKAKIFLLILSLFYVLALTSAFISDNSTPYIYLIGMYAMLVYPFFVSRNINDKYILLFAFLFVYFLYFAMADLLALMPYIQIASAPRGSDLLSEAEVAILVGGASMILGYTACAVFFGQRGKILTNDWPIRSIVIIGILCWGIGIIGTGAWQFLYSDRNINAIPSPVLGTLITLARYLQPLGDAMIAYAFFTTRSKYILILLVLILGIEVPFGFLADSKELSVKGMVITIVVKFLLDGRASIKWLLPLMIFLVSSFSLAQAYRFEVLQQRGQLRTEAASNLDKTVEDIKNSKLIREGIIQSSVEYLVSRLNMKNNIVLIVTKTGNPVPYQDGYTLKLLLYAWIPRIIYPEKPEISVGRLFNQEFKISLDPNTYISTSFPGEFYWNYGMSGLVIGMFLFGGLLGLMGALFNMSRTKSVTRLLILVTTIYFLCFRFETGFALEINQWLRVMILSIILHAIFKQRGGKRASEAQMEHAEGTLNDAYTSEYNGRGRAMKLRSPLKLLR